MVKLKERRDEAGIDPGQRLVQALDDLRRKGDVGLGTAIDAVATACAEWKRDLLERVRADKAEYDAERARAARAATSRLGDGAPETWPCCGRGAGEPCGRPNEGNLSHVLHGAEQPSVGNVRQPWTTEPCQACGTPVGGAHHAGCQLAQCGNCHRRLALCGHRIEGSST
jgi:hypothetical protein